MPCRALVTDLARRLLADGLQVELEVTGGSMAPAIRSHDRVVLEPLDPSGVRLGDIVAIEPAPGRMTIHRVVRWSGEDVVTRGDASAWDDDATSLATVLARVTTIRREGRLQRWGLGPERRVIAWASRLGLLAPVCVRWLRDAPKAPEGRPKA